MNTSALAKPDQFMPLIPSLDNDLITRLNLAGALFMLAGFIVFVPAWLIDTRTLDSALVWTKPQKFHISLALHFATLAILLQLVPRDVRTGPILTTFSYLAIVSLLIEFVWVTVQAGRARRSHFNYDSALEGLMYAAMGVGAFFLVAVAMALAVQIWRKGDRSKQGLWLGAVLGLSLAFVTSLIFAYFMSSNGRYVGGPMEGGGATVPFFGWSREYGDLRPAHFVSLHLMQTLPLAGWLADRQGWNGKLVVIGVGIAQTALATALFFQALAGKPFWPA